MTHYNSGRAFEWRVRDALTEDGYDVIRSAGSKTKVDLAAFKPGQLLLVQCKRTGGTIPPAERADLLRIAGYVGAVPIVAHRSRPRGPIAYRLLTGPGPKEWTAWTPDVEEVAP